MSGHPDEPPIEPAAEDMMAEPDEHPRGTLVLMFVFLLLIAGMFTWTYLTLLERS